MLIFKKTKDLISYLTELRLSKKSIGFVPTMGALHEGHISLIQKASKENDLVVCSIFVNPSQFNQKEDFDKYPISTSKDIKMLVQASCDILFLPLVDEIYPIGWQTQQNLDLGGLEKLWEGHFRPGHFDGVVQIVSLLLEIVCPQKLYLGQKDYQQCAIIQKLISIKKYSIQLEICSTIREADGLAMSSRNARLAIADRQIASALFQAATYIKNHFQTMPNKELLESAKSLFLQNERINLEYMEIVDRLDLSILEKEKTHAVLIIAAWVGGVRLIDNMLL